MKSADNQNSEMVDAFIDESKSEIDFSLIESIEEKIILQKLYEIHQYHIIEKIFQSDNRKLIFSQLKDVEDFYSEAGGIKGYQNLVLKQLDGCEKKEDSISCPISHNIACKNSQVEKWVDLGIESMPLFCEIYVVGGAADRLGFFHPDSNEPLPAASYQFLGKPLLQHLIEDLEAREYLYFKKYGVRLFTPICLMTSDETNNYQRIRTLLEDKKYFGRPKETFIFVRQPMVPVLDQEGNWLLNAQGQLILKPSGHGALWTACIKQQVFKTLKKRGCRYALIRQINNPIIGIDYNLPAFMGAGIDTQKDFGFFVTKRVKGNSEGAIVYKKNLRDGCVYKLVTNVEYCQLQNDSISEDYPANTNLLFVNLESIIEAAKKLPYPGALLNFKGTKQSKPQARLELTMQNICEAFLDENDDLEAEHKSVFLVMQERSKAISTIKKFRNDLLEQNETPLKAYYEIFLAYHHFFKEVCQFDLPLISENFEKFIGNPSYHFLLHKGLGPSFEQLSKKLKSWKIYKDSWIDLQIVNGFFEKISIFGAFKIQAEKAYDFSSQPSFCMMQNIQIENQGFEKDLWNPFFPIEASFKECFSVTLGKNSAFIAKDVIFKGHEMIAVPDGKALVITNFGRSIMTIDEAYSLEIMGGIDL